MLVLATLWKFEDENESDDQDDMIPAVSSQVLLGSMLCPVVVRID